MSSCINVLLKNTFLSKRVLIPNTTCIEKNKNESVSKAGGEIRNNLNFKRKINLKLPYYKGKYVSSTVLLKIIVHLTLTQHCKSTMFQ